MATRLVPIHKLQGHWESGPESFTDNNNTIGMFYVVDSAAHKMKVKRHYLYIEN